MKNIQQSITHLIFLTLLSTHAYASYIPLNTAQTGNVGFGTTTPQAGLVILTGNVGVGTWTSGAKVQVNNTINFLSEYDNGNSTATVTINWNNGNKQKVTLNAASVAVTFTAPTSGVANYLLRVLQDGSGNRVIASWTVAGGTVKWGNGSMPTMTVAASAIDLVSCFFNGTDFFCDYSLNFQ